MDHIDSNGMGHIRISMDTDSSLKNYTDAERRRNGTTPFTPIHKGSLSTVLKESPAINSMEINGSFLRAIWSRH